MGLMAATSVGTLVVDAVAMSKASEQSNTAAPESTTPMASDNITETREARRRNAQTITTLLNPPGLKGKQSADSK